MYLTLKQLGMITFQNVISFSDIFHSKYNMLVWNWSDTMNISTALSLLLAWCFSTRAAVATVLSTQPCISSHFLVKVWFVKHRWNLQCKTAIHISKASTQIQTANINVWYEWQHQYIYLHISKTLQWRHYEHDGVSNHQPHDCLFNCLFKAQIKENIKAPRHWPLWGEFTGNHWIPHTKGQ